MKIFLCKKYVGYSILISLFMLAFLASVSLFRLTLGMVAKSFLAGGTVGVFITYKYFAYLNYWVLYSNLKISKYRCLAIFYLAYMFVIFFIIVVYRDFIAGI